MTTKILLADDDAGLRRVIQFKLSQKGYNVTSVNDGIQAIKEIRKADYDLLLTDMKMPGINGIELLKQVKSLKPGLEVILITAFAAVPQAVKAMKLGAFDYLTKPFDDDQLFITIEKAVKFKKLEDENRLLKQQLDDRTSLNHIYGVSSSYKEMMELVEKIAPTDATILLSGESGSGKEVIARTIHAKSLRADKSLIAVNCAAIPRELIESELFGHVKGAFTGAVKDKKGKFELANGGTLLLDEISELNIELQAKLLRVIQERVIEPVGSEYKIEIDIRLIAATNKNLSEKVTQGKFREDLFYRLNVIPIHIPPLRERKEDIPILVKGFLNKFSSDKQINIDNELMDILINNQWKGNVRELENLIERMVILRKSDTLTRSDLPPDILTETSVIKKPVHSSYIDRDNFNFYDAEKKLILDALEKCSHNKSKAANLLKIPRHVLVYRMKKYDIFYNS